MVCHEIFGRVTSHLSVGHPGRSETEIRDQGARALPFERVPTPSAGRSPIPARAGAWPG
ncbi:hypothetical protein ACSSV1_003795 [Labrenzia sp. MBR-25]|jgi:hypothetical protein